MDINVQKGYLITDNKFIVRLDKIVDGFIDTNVVDKEGIIVLFLVYGNDECCGRLLEEKDEIDITRKLFNGKEIEIRRFKYPIHDKEVFNSIYKGLINTYNIIRKAQYDYLDVFM